MTRKQQKLSPKQEKFIREYLKDNNATKAAVRAGYSKKTARQAGQRLLTNVVIKQRVEKVAVKVLDKIELDAGMVIKELMALAFTNTADFIDWTDKDCRIIPKADIPKDKLKALSELTVKQNIIKEISDEDEDGEETVTMQQINVEYKVKTYDKTKALDKLGQYLKLWNSDNNPKEVKLTIEQVIAKAKEAAQNKEGTA